MKSSLLMLRRKNAMASKDNANATEIGEEKSDKNSMLMNNEHDKL